jgi:hypothetical protein
MQSSNQPTRIPVPFANSGTKNTIPVPSQIGVTPGAASFTDGFPPLTFTPLVAGGVPPAGADFNGIFNAITKIQQWQSAGGFFKYDSAFSTSIGGYPKGAILINTTHDGLWINQVENNTTNPDTGGSDWMGMPRILSINANSPPASDLNLNIGDQVIVTFSSLTAIPLSIATQGGVYQIELIATDNTGIVELGLQPNNVTYAGQFLWTVTEAADDTPGHSDGSVLPNPLVVSNYGATYLDKFYMDPFYGPFSPSPNETGPFLYSIIANTATVAKMVKYTSGIRGGFAGGYTYWGTGSGLDYDTTTSWTSLGTIENGAALSGLINVRRLG